MEFRLTYEGPLLATQRDPVMNQKDGRADHKHEIRRTLHPQLKHLWAVHPFLRDFRIDERDLDGMLKLHYSQAAHITNSEREEPLADILSRRYGMFGYTFIPLVCEQFALACAIDVLFLRRDPPGSVIQSGDIDNRLKTLMDGLRLPKNATELGRYVIPGTDETPFFCLLEDDRLITKLTVETDWLLDPMKGTSMDAHDVRLVIKITIGPSTVNGINLNFA